MVDEVGLVNAEHVLEFLWTHELVSRVDARWVELDVKWLSVTSHQTPWQHQQKKDKLNNYFQPGKDIHHKQGAELWSCKHLGGASAGEGVSGAAAPED